MSNPRRISLTREEEGLLEGASGGEWPCPAKVRLQGTRDQTEVVRTVHHLRRFRAWRDKNATLPREREVFHAPLTFQAGPTGSVGPSVGLSGLDRNRAAL